MKLVLFVKLGACWFFLLGIYCALIFLKLVHIDSSLREACTFIFLLVKLILFTELVVCWFLFVKLVACRFSLRETCTLIFSPYETDFAQGTSCVLIFCLWNFLHIDFSHCEALTLIFLHVKLVLFMELSACWFLFIELGVSSIFLFVKLVHWFLSSWNWICSWNLLRAYCCSWNFLCTGFFRETYCMLIFLLVKRIHWVLSS